MKAAWYEHMGLAREVLTVGSMPTPTPLADEVLIRVRASGVNPSDVKKRAGRPPTEPRIVPHSDGAGVIEDVGPGVPRERIGQRVWIWNGQWKRPFGTAAEFIALPQQQAVPLPDNTSFEEGACLGIPALTALHALTVDDSVAGERVLVTGGAGAVGAYAIQMARLMGAASVITTVSSDAKATLALSLGADHTLNYKTENVVERVRALTRGAGIDRIVEVDAAANVGQMVGAIARDGLYVVYGSGKPAISFDFLPMITLNVGVRFFMVYELAPAARAKCLATLSTYLRGGLLRHSIARSYPIENIAEAHEAVESGTVVGNVVVTFGE